MALKSHIAFEGEVRTREEWVTCLHRSKGEKVFNRFLETGALRKPGTRIDLYRLDFVGLSCFEDEVLVCLPKVFERNGGNISARELNRIIRCVQEYQSRRRSLGESEIANDPLINDVGPLLNTFVSLLSWTHDNGIHQTEMNTLSSSESGIDWPSTFDNSSVAHLRTGPVYTDLYGYHATSSESLIGYIQAVALQDLHGMFGIVAELWVSEFDTVLETCREVVATFVDPPILSEFRQMISEAASNTTKDHDRDLINLLMQWCDLESKIRGKVGMFGINAFHVVWEDMCRVALSIKQAIAHSNIASQPFSIVGSDIISLGQQRPDHILIEGNCVWLLDAKWYRPWKGEYPSVPDVIKQLMYSLTTASEYQVVGNFFVMPSSEAIGVLEKIGDSKMIFNGSVDGRLPYISLLVANWNIMLDLYLSNATSSTFFDKIKCL